MTAQLPSTTLYYKDGSSDKVYQCSIEAKGTGFVVNFAYGRRGATLKSGTKTNSPVTIAEAEKIYAAQLREKTSKGYTPGVDGKIYTQTEHAGKKSSFVPQLLNFISRDEAEKLILDSSFVGQEKHDGQRMILAKTGQDIQASNKKGLITNFPDEVKDALLTIKADFVLDGEMIGETYYIFDALSLPVDKNLATQGFESRSKAVAAFGKAEGIPTAPVGETIKGTLFIVRTAYTTAEKRNLFDTLEAKQKEGMVFKNASSTYIAGRPASGGSQRKFKFYETASVKVIKVNAQRSVGFAVLDGKHWVPVGNVTIPGVQPLPDVDSIIEVRYLYAYKGGSLFQPIYQGKRVDVDADECIISQLKYKS